MAKSHSDCLKTYRKHDFKMETVYKVSAWLTGNGFKQPELNLFEKMMDPNNNLYVKIGKHIVTIGVIFVANNTIHQRLLNSAKLSDGSDVVVECITEELKKY